MKLTPCFRWAARVGLALVASVGTAQADVIADSIADWSPTGTQGENDWYYGYYNLTDDETNGDGIYQADDFQEFINIGGPIEPYDDPAFGDQANHWNGNNWDMADAASFTSPRQPGGNVPWTNLIANGNVHPNGTNSGGIEHWAIRRWVADELTEVTPLAVTWFTRKANGNGNGVTGGIAVNGEILDQVSIAGTDQVGVERTYYINASPGDIIDLINTPEGADGGRGDGSDGSNHWMTVDTTIPVPAFQPDGTLFRSATAADTDGDGIDDSWEELFGEAGDLDRFSENGDFESDGLTDLKEFLHGSDPTKSDTDEDGVPDVVEEGFGSSSNSAESDGDGISDFDEVNGNPPTNPGKADGDEDGADDPEELLWGSDPNDAADTPLTLVVANSQTEWSSTGTQGEGDWFYGYYDRTDDELIGDGVYQTADFRPFFNEFGAGGGQVEPDGNHWNGTIWDMANGTSVGGNVPWTAIQPELGHPNGTNNGVEHWAIRRWVADELTEPTAVGIIWHLRKQNGNATGTSGVLMVNGEQVDKVTVAGNDQTGQIRRVFVNLQPGDIVELALTPEGRNARGGVDPSDGSDTSYFWYRVDTRIPAVPVQPDGRYFVPVGSEDTDGDDLADFWERLFFPDNLDRFSGDGDFDEDGMTDGDEMAKGGFPNVKDTDGDGLEDGRETGTGVAGAGDETGTDVFLADTDADGKNDGDEVDGPTKTDPFDRDSDDDDLTDGQETNTGVWVSIDDVGSDPNLQDSDDDGLFDGDEVYGTATTDFLGANVVYASDPNLQDSDGDLLLDTDELFTTLTHPWRFDTDGDGTGDGEEDAAGTSPFDAPDLGIEKPDNVPDSEIADSEIDFTVDGTQGENGWFYGYRNVTLDGGGENYHPDDDFIEFEPQFWNGNRWDLGGGAPWTEVTQTGGHPNGTNNVEEHWAIRRWVADVASPTPALVTWKLGKTNTNGGNGTSAALYVNGEFKASLAVGGTDGTGRYLSYFLNLNPGDKIDLALKPAGPDGNPIDGSDGSFFGFFVDTELPNDPRQPDGTPFVVGEAGDLEVVSVVFDPLFRSTTIVWKSVLGTKYDVWVSDNLKDWTPLATGLDASDQGAGTTTAFTEESIPASVTVRYYSVREAAAP